MNSKPTAKFPENRLCYGILAIIVPFFLFAGPVFAQERLDTPIKLKIEDGGFEEVSVVVKNNTTNETHTVAGAPKLDIVLKLNCDYVISFSKPGYITKKIALNTTAPADRISQGFYPFNFEVVLFKQYDGVNIVIFNQPVGKISFNRLIDDFDYDTDYTKQIQSALKKAEEEIKQKQQEAKAQAEQLLKEEAKKKAEEAAQAKIAEKAKIEADKKAAEEAKAMAAQAAKEKKAEEERRKLAEKTVQEEERKKALAKMEEEERAKAKAAEAEEARKKSSAVVGNDTPSASLPAGSGEEQRNKIKPGGGTDTPVSASASGSGEEMGKSRPAAGSGDDQQDAALADPTKRQDAGISKAKATSGSESRSESPKIEKPEIKPAVTPTETFEVLPDISVEEITETNRVITRVIVRKNQKETIFSKVKYNWGGIYYFRQNVSISESLFFMNTGRR